MKTIDIMIGIPGSGKSTLAKIISKDTGAIIFSSDEIRKELVDNKIIEEDYNKSTNKIVFDELFNRFINALKQGKDIIIDATNLEKKFRAGYITNAKMFNYYIKGRYIKITKKQAIERVIQRQTNNPDVHQIENPKKIVNDFYKKLKENLPNIDEGFDEIVTYQVKKEKLEILKIDQK